MAENSFRQHICKQLHKEPALVSAQALDEITYLERQRDELCRVVARFCDTFEQGKRLSVVYDAALSLSHAQSLVNDARRGYTGPVFHRDSAQRPLVVTAPPAANGQHHPELVSNFA